ncbi:unnamed protein product [Didymodactylos carnosus]|uniref:Zinc finger FYVE domain-containing protein 1 n=1 Tax=Didymodactylos carnosus TaxID=1234261 RepID=A0A814AUG5_9BILA|nr:unnamed protein product [Didymodactylos carnosus]CAF0920021.1 unnamed protein product [Didymodactylos carnosus]CAF3601535.1 unnamed protein product [Didymodactylos carnosus]CAF3699472.1 unnamed protein product [Didymodactylos carnosus]
MSPSIDDPSPNSSSPATVNSFLTCAERVACESQLTSEASYFCITCNTLQCKACENDLHKNINDNEQHERFNLSEIENELCSTNKQHHAVFYCTQCRRFYCYPCWEDQHCHGAARQHKPSKTCQDTQTPTTPNNQKHNDQFPQPVTLTQKHHESKPIKIPPATDKHTSSSSSTNIVGTKTSTGKSASFEDLNHGKFQNIDMNNDDEHSEFVETDNRYHHSKKERSSSTTFKQKPTSSRYSSSAAQLMLPKQHNFDEHLLLESMLDDEDTPSAISKKKQDHHRNKHDEKREEDGGGGLLLLDAKEHLTVNNEQDFLRKLQCEQTDLNVKCLSIIGNTGDGKSHTLNQIFFKGTEVFQTSSSSNSCTMGIWAALDQTTKTLVLDTEGLLGISQNANIRNRLLLKILCISDIIVFRTRAQKLPNDMFHFLSDASNAFLKFFRKELENVMKNLKADGPITCLGPTLVVFHETQHTDVLRDDLQTRKTAVEQLKERFEKMKCSYEAYSTIEYVGIQTKKLPTNFGELRSTIFSTLDNNKIRSPRKLSVIYNALKALNEKFNQVIPDTVPSSLPDDFFTCCLKCIACGSKCVNSANHQKEDLPHSCNEPCMFIKEIGNEVFKCLQCHREGRDVIVPCKIVTKSDSLVSGLAKYVWSGYVIECPFHGEVFRSRKYWYGNNDPKDVTRAEIVHVWPGDDITKLASDITPRKIMESVLYVGSYLSAPTAQVREWVADSVAPTYWTPNRDIAECSQCKLLFGLEHSKHHCRACGLVFCESCTSKRRIISWINNETPLRVCDKCYLSPTPPTIRNTVNHEKISTSHNHVKDTRVSPSSSSTTTATTTSGEDLCMSPTEIFDIESPSGTVSTDIPTSRRVYETVKNQFEKMAVTYPLELIKESTRPGYWRPDNECRACFICHQSFNNTTKRLHHCRNCGDCVCESCSPTKRPVPERDWITPVRVCKLCDRAMNEGRK